MRINYRSVIYFLILLFPCFLYAEEVRILDWGIEQYRGTGDQSARLLIEISNDCEKSATYTIEFKKEKESNPFARSRFNAAAKTTKREELAVPSSYLESNYYLEIKRSDGKTIHKFQMPELQKPLEGPDRLIIIYSKDNAGYREVQEKLLSSGSIEDQADKSRKVRVIRPRYLPIHWWAYESTSIILIAKPIDSFKPEELGAMEGYARSGGHLVLIEPELHDNHFLAQYREKSSEGADQAIGNGCLTRLHSMADLESRFSKFEDLWNYHHKWPNPADFSLGYLQCTLGTVYRFPNIWTVTGILVFFLLLVGPINFFIIRRIQKPEWGWITVPAISLIFAAALLGFALARRPSRLSLDEFSFAEMDDRSSKAFVTTNIRVSSPIRYPVRLQFFSNTLLSEQFNSRMTLELNKSKPRGNEIAIPEIGSEPQWSGELLPLSYREGRFQTMKDYSGNVSRISPKLLRNSAGVSFFASLLITPQDLYELGAFRNNEEKDISSVKRSPLSSYYETDKNAVYENMVEYYAGISRKDLLEKWQSQPFSIIHLVDGIKEEMWKDYFKNHTAVFIGISESEPTVRINNSDAAKEHKTITIIDYY